jgi:metalloendopeptidase OMA1, mitochondrial
MAAPVPRTPAITRFPIAVVVCASLFFGVISLGCGGFDPSGDGEGPGHRKQVLELSPQQELDLGRKAYREVLSNPQKYGRVMPADSAEVERVRRIAGRLIHAAEIEPLQREMNLLNKSEVNAFCLPGGKIAVYTGLLKVAANDDQIAGVLGHEMGHALAHHANERIAHDEINHTSSDGFWTKAFDRAQESEADHIGLFLMTFAGYDPDEIVRFWERMMELTQGHERPEILSDHPSDAHRIHDLKEWIPKARAAKKAYDEGNIAPAR